MPLCRGASMLDSFTAPSRQTTPLCRFDPVLHAFFSPDRFAALASCWARLENR